jgi:NADPH-dependent 2,4-dienoyl-CoA reductase/sulfur reductase-like enzyme
MALERRFDVLVVGAGPAGLAAAWAASQGGRRVGLVDENRTFGGQIWRGADSAHDANPPREARGWFEKVDLADVTFLSGARVVAQPAPGVLQAETPDDQTNLSYEKLILAPGARELFLPFPGWTLPNVFGAGGLQALAKSGLTVEGRSVVVAGSGPLLLAVASYLKAHGAAVRLIAEQAPAGRVARFGLGLVRSPAKLAQAAGLKIGLRGVPYRSGCWPVEARGAGRVTSVTLTDGRRTWDEPCDYLACGFGLVPNTELPRALGCEVRRGSVAVNNWQETTAEHIFCAGEATGIGGLDKSLVEGQIAGFAASGRRDEARRLFAARDDARAFAAALAQAFALRDELKALPRPETTVCRCEDVTWGQLLAYSSTRAAKLQTRCGMGPCQGRICGASLAFLRGWPPDSPRPPVFPSRLGSLAGGDVAGSVAD